MGGKQVGAGVGMQIMNYSKATVNKLYCQVRLAKDKREKT